MLNSIISFVVYLFIATAASWIFKFIAGIIETIIVFPLLGSNSDKQLAKMESRPRFFFTVLTVKNVLIGLANSIMIFMVTATFLERTGENFWFYAVLSVIWSLFIISLNSAFPVMMFTTSTITLVLFWFGFGGVAWIATGLVALVVSLAYYYGKVHVILSQRSYDKYI